VRLGNRGELDTSIDWNLSQATPGDLREGMVEVRPKKNLSGSRISVQGNPQQGVLIVPLRREQVRMKEKGNSQRSGRRVVHRRD